jgi:GntR family transcriptional regulator, rspAB operon transcriptional repressor
MNDTLRHKAHQEIKNRIIFFEVMPGERLSDRQLADALDMGRTPVREALLMLEREKLVRCDGKQGYFVRKLTQKEVEDYLSVRAALETYAVPLMIKNVTPLVIEELEENILRSEECAKEANFHDMTACNAEFHNILYRVTNSDVFLEIMSGLDDKFHWLRAIALRAGPGSPEQGLEGHKIIVDALKRKDARALERAFEIHLHNVKEKYLLMARLFPLTEKAESRR